MRNLWESLSTIIWFILVAIMVIILMAIAVVYVLGRSLRIKASFRKIELPSLSFK